MLHSERETDMEYTINVRETLETQVKVEADNLSEALGAAEQNWKRGEYILDSECFTGVDFSEIKG